MSKPEDIPQDVWRAAQANALSGLATVAFDTIDENDAALKALTNVIARAIMAAKAEEREVFTDLGRDNDALNSAVGIFRMQQTQPHKSAQEMLWEAIKDYSERATLKKRGEG